MFLLTSGGDRRELDGSGSDIQTHITPDEGGGQCLNRGQECPRHPSQLVHD
jgi:hypothetical protein